MSIPGSTIPHVAAVWFFSSIGCLLAIACGEPSATRINNRSIAASLATCDNCEIRLDDRFKTDSKDPNIQEATYYMELGNYLWTMGGFALETIVRFDLRTGDSHAYYRKGEGPGEISDQVMGAYLDPSGDTLVIAQPGRIEFFSRDLEPIRSFRPPVLVRGSLVGLDDGSMVVSNTRAAGDAKSGSSLHQIAPEGADLGAFRAVEPSFAGEWLPLSRGHEPLTVWVAIPQPSGFIAEQWSVQDRLRLRELTFEATWWYTKDVTGPELEARLLEGEVDADVMRPESGTVALYDDGSVLWAAIRQADAGYANADLRYSLPNRSVDSFLLALDRDTGDILASELFDEFAFGFTNLGHLVLYSVEDNGQPVIRLKRFVLTR